MSNSSVWPLFAVGTLAWTASAGPGMGWSAPTSHKAGQFAAGLYQPPGQAVLVVLGDSINAPHAIPGMQVGYRDQLEIPFNGWVVHAGNGISELGYTNASGTLATNAMRGPGEEFSSGVSSIAPVRARDIVWGANAAPGQQLSDSFILNEKLANMRLGNPFASDAPIDVRLMMYEGSTQVGGFQAAGMRGSVAVHTGNYVRPATVANAIRWIDRELPPGLGNPGIRLRADATTDESTPGANTLIHLGTRFRARLANGVQMQIIAHDGWTTLDHVDPGRFTDAALAGYYAATDPPTHIVLWIGQNQTLEESTDIYYGRRYAVYKSNVEAVIARHDAVIAAMGAPAPRWLVVSQFKTGYEEFQHELMSAALYRIAAEQPRVAFLNLYRLAGGETFDRQKYLVDGVHPSAAGAQFLAALMNHELKAALAASCPTDFDRSGFVDMVDYDEYVLAFEAGSIDADFDASGFVDVEDFTLFVEAFIAGC